MRVCPRVYSLDFCMFSCVGPGEDASLAGQCPGREEEERRGGDREDAVRPRSLLSSASLFLTTTGTRAWQQQGGVGLSKACEEDQVRALFRRRHPPPLTQPLGPKSLLPSSTTAALLANPLTLVRTCFEHPRVYTHTKLCFPSSPAMISNPKVSRTVLGLRRQAGVAPLLYALLLLLPQEQRSACLC